MTSLKGAIEIIGGHRPPSWGHRGPLSAQKASKCGCPAIRTYIAKISLAPPALAYIIQVLGQGVRKFCSPYFQRFLKANISHAFVTTEMRAYMWMCYRRYRVHICLLCVCTRRFSHFLGCVILSTITVNVIRDTLSHWCPWSPQGCKFAVIITYCSFWKVGSTARFIFLLILQFVYNRPSSSYWLFSAYFVITPVRILPG